jgi:hypothetical protein
MVERFQFLFVLMFIEGQPVLCILLHDPKKGCGIQCVRKPVVPYIIVSRTSYLFRRSRQFRSIIYQHLRKHKHVVKLLQFQWERIVLPSLSYTVITTHVYTDNTVRIFCPMILYVSDDKNDVYGVFISTQSIPQHCNINVLTLQVL